MISANNLSMRFGGKILFKNANLQLLPGGHYGLVGPNGSGKSTLIKILDGEVIPESGNVAIPAHQTIGTLKQDHFIYDTCIIRDVVIMGKQRLWQAMQHKEKLLHDENDFSEQHCHELADCEKIIDTLHGYTAHSTASQILDGLGIPSHLQDQPMSTLSGGYKLRVLLAQLLFSAPDVMLLDEPTNHLDIFSIAWLEGYLQSFPGILVLSSHDRHFLNAVCTSIIDLDYSVITVYKGNYTTFEETKEKASVLREAMLNKQEKRKEEMMEFVDRFRAKASKASQAQSRLKAAEKLEAEIEAQTLAPSSRRYPKFQFHLCRPSGAIAVKVHGLAKSYGPKRVLHNVNFEIERGEHVAFVGANGIGKSTLLEILMQNLPADEGSFTWGFAAHCAYFPQDHAREVSGKISLLDWLGQFDSQATREKLQSVLALSLFSGDDVTKQVSVLSGGEVARLILAKIMLIKHNILIFDEPTNHLDMEAIEILMHGLQEYPGTVLFVSHNRYFVEKIATRVIEITPEGILDYKCSYAEYAAKRELDHLDVKKSLRNPQKAPDKANEQDKHPYVDQKKAMRQKEHMKRKAEQAENKCHLLEKKLAEINAMISSEGFYTASTKNEQEAILVKKQKLEDDLLIAMEEWEKANE